MIAMLLLLAQATPDTPQRFSILVPDCARAPATHDEIVVCAPDGTTASSRLPLPEERGPPNHGIPSNPNLTGVAALAVEGTPCAATQWGCQVGFGPPIAPIVAGAVDLAKKAFAKKPDKRGRVPIDLGEPVTP